jgi:hypothetical protein
MSEVTEQDLISEFQRIADTMHAKTEQKLVEHRAQTERLIRERTARPPSAFTGGSTANRGLPLLGGDQKFRDWLGGPRGAKSSYAASFTDFRIETKASPLLNTGNNVHVGGIAAPPTNALRLVELLPIVGMSSGAAAEYAQETSFTAGAEIVPQGQTKPTTAIDYTNVLATIKTIATITKVSLQGLADTPGLGEWLDARLRYAVQLKAEDHLLNGAAPDGLLAAAGALDPDYAPSGTPTPLDVIGAAIGQLQSNGYVADGIVLNGLDVNKTRLLKTSTGEYLWSSPDGAIGTASMWSVPVIISPSIAAGSWLVGAFAQSALLFVRQMLVVEVAFQNEDDFIKNLACLRAEERIGSAVPVPAGLIKGTF